MSMPAAECWRAVVARDVAADGRFVFAVRTTGIYCRPSCGARRPKRAHVAFFADATAAQAAGYRACRRCRPDDPAWRSRRLRQVEQWCRRLDVAEGPVPLAELARSARTSPASCRRLFRALVGVTPRDYAAARRAERAARSLAAGNDVTAATVAAGYSSSSRAHAGLTPRLGMQPGRARRGGAGEHLEFAVLPCALGHALVAATARGVAAILLGDDDGALVQELAQRFPRAERRRGDRAFAARIGGVIAVVDGRGSDPGLPLDIRGTAFQQRVWAELRRVAAGTTVDYGELARRVGQPGAARAVARACADNALAVVVPCHRVVRKGGALAGYRWGVERKRALLRREGRAPE